MNLHKAVSLAILVVAVATAWAGSGDQWNSARAVYADANDALTRGSVSLRAFRNPLSLDQVRSNYESSERELLSKAMVGFAGLLDDGTYGTLALDGCRDACYWLLKGQRMMGNDHLVAALRMRYGLKPEEVTLDSEIAELDNAIDEFEQGLAVIGYLSCVPDALDANNVLEAQDLMARLTQARGERAARDFAMGSQYPLRRTMATEDLREVVQCAYLAQAALGGDGPSSTRTTLAQRLGPKIGAVANTFDQIVSGINPGGYHDKYIPFLPYCAEAGRPSLRALADSLTSGTDTSATAWQTKAEQATRAVDQQSRELNSQLASIRNRVIARLGDVTGIDPRDKAYFPDGMYLNDPGRISDYMEAAKAQSVGEIALQMKRIDEAQESMNAAYMEIQDIPERIKIEEERVGQIKATMKGYAKDFVVLDIAEGVARAVRYKATIGITIESGQSVEFDPSELVIGGINARRDWLRAMQEIDILEINSAAQIKNMLLTQAEKVMALEVDQTRIEQAQICLNTLEMEVHNFLAEWQASLDDLKLWNDPGYRLDMEYNVQQANESLAMAQQYAFLAAQALSYDWVCDFPGPITMQPPFDMFDSPESVFRTTRADQVKQFLSALSVFHIEMHPGSEAQNSESLNPPLSIRRDVLAGGASLDEKDSIAHFRQFLADHWNEETKCYDFTFTVSIADQTVFPISAPSGNHWNVKIDGLSARVLLGNSKRGTAQKATMDVAIGGMSVVRQKDAQWRLGDASGDILVFYDLESMGGTDQARQTTLETYIDNWPTSADEIERNLNTGLNRISVASTWRIVIDTTKRPNIGIDWANLDDIELWIQYRMGAPVNLCSMQ